MQGAGSSLSWFDYHPRPDEAQNKFSRLYPGEATGWQQRWGAVPELVRHGLHQLIELEVAAVLRADRHQRSEDRFGYRNGNRARLLTTQVGEIQLQIPKLRAGNLLSSILEPRRLVHQAPYGVVMEADIAGISSRMVDALVAALGFQSSISTPS